MGFIRGGMSPVGGDMSGNSPPAAKCRRAPASASDTKSVSPVSQASLSEDRRPAIAWGPSPALGHPGQGSCSFSDHSLEGLSGPGRPAAVDGMALAGCPPFLLRASTWPMAAPAYPMVPPHTRNRRRVRDEQTQSPANATPPPPPRGPGQHRRQEHGGTGWW